MALPASLLTRPPYRHNPSSRGARFWIGDPDLDLVEAGIGDPDRILLGFLERPFDDALTIDVPLDPGRDAVGFEDLEANPDNAVIRQIDPARRTGSADLFPAKAFPSIGLADIDPHLIEQSTFELFLES